MTGQVTADFLPAPDKIGIISNCWALALKNGERFEDLADRFVRNGFAHLEIRDGDYLRCSPFGGLLTRIEEAMDRYSDTEWKTICTGLASDRSGEAILKSGQADLEKEIRSFLSAVTGFQVSYAISHPWLSAADDRPSENRCLATAIKVAYLLSPSKARLRLVAPPQENNFQFEVATANLKRYRSLLPDYSLTYAVENGLGVSAVRISEAARAGGFVMAYDEANVYGNDGTALHDPGDFRQGATRESLASIHLKQRNRDGNMPRLAPGYVDFKAVFRRAREMNYQGDWLFELTPTSDPLESALQSLAFLSEIF